MVTPSGSSNAEYTVAAAACVHATRLFLLILWLVKIHMFFLLLSTSHCNIMALWTKVITEGTEET